MSVGEVAPRRQLLTRRGQPSGGSPKPAAKKDATPSGIYPLDAPGLAPPGPDFMDLARALGDTSELVGKTKTNKKLKVSEDGILGDLIYRALHSNGDFALPVRIPGGKVVSMNVLGGHRWGDGVDSVQYGPRPAKVMVIGKMLIDDDLQQGRHFTGAAGELLLEICRQLGIPCRDWYMTDLMKTVHPLDGKDNKLKSSWIDDWLPLLQQELRIVRPQFILCLGAEAVAAVFKGRQFDGLKNGKATISGLRGRVVEYDIPLQRSEDGPGFVNKALLMATVHPSSVRHDPENQEQLEDDLSRFGQLIRGHRWDQEESGIDHRVIDNLEDLIALHDEVQRDCEDNLIAIDAEWHGDHPQNKGAYLRTVQLSWKPKTAACISLRHPGGAPRFRGGIDQALLWFERICRGKRIAGHYLNADMEWLLEAGVDLREEFSVADNWLQCMEEANAGKKGGFDTAYACHAFNETGEFALTPLSLRYTSAPRYDAELEKWKKRYCSQHKLKPKDLEGYGECPNEILEPYGNYDADVTRRLVLEFMPRLDCDRFGNNCWEAFWMSMRAAPATLEMKMTGMPIDRDRIDRLTDVFMAGRNRLLEAIRAYAKWPSFNINAVEQVREFLYGEELNGKEKKNPNDPPIRLRPEDAISLYLEPVLASGKPTMRWSEVVERGLVGQRNPSTDKTTLAILVQDAKKVRRRDSDGRLFFEDLSGPVDMVRGCRVLAQVLKSSLRPPLLDKEDVIVLDEDGKAVYPGGLAASICGDGRVRTTLYQTKETRRWSSARPALQNLSGKEKENEYKKILKELYQESIRSIFVAPPGHVFIEADYKGAELFGMAVLSGDRTMLEHVRRNQLPETDRDYFDIHSYICCLAFGFQCPYTKAGLDSIGKADMRRVAKAVIFGVAYGRGAKAIVISAKEQGVEITVEEAQAVIDTIFATYPRLKDFFNECRSRSRKERWICGAFGGFRRFPATTDRTTQGDLEREAMNFPIQNLVADAVNRACDYLWQYRETHDDVYFRFGLQIHDSLMFVVPTTFVPKMLDEVIPECMCNRIPICCTGLDGAPKNNKPYRMAVDTKIQVRWSESLNPDQLQAMGISPKYDHWIEHPQGWVHVEKPKFVWHQGAMVPRAALEQAA